MRVLLALLGTILVLFGLASGGCAVTLMLIDLDASLNNLIDPEFLLFVACLAIGAGLTWIGVTMLRRAFRPKSRSCERASPTEES